MIINTPNDGDRDDEQLEVTPAEIIAHAHEVAQNPQLVEEVIKEVSDLLWVFEQIIIPVHNSTAHQFEDDGLGNCDSCGWVGHNPMKMHNGLTMRESAQERIAYISNILVNLVNPNLQIIENAIAKYIELEIELEDS